MSGVEPKFAHRTMCIGNLIKILQNIRMNQDLLWYTLTHFTFADANVGSEQSTLRQLGNRRENLAPSGQLSLSFVHLSRTVLKSWKSEQHSCAKPSVYIIAP